MGGVVDVLEYTREDVIKALKENAYAKGKAAKALKCGSDRFNRILVELDIDIDLLKKVFPVKRNMKKRIFVAKSPQFSKEELEAAMRDNGNNKDKAAESLGVGSWSFREQLKKHGLNEDQRAFSQEQNKSKMLSKEELEDMYYNKGMSLNEMSEHCGASNVTIAKWFEQYGIKQRTHVNNFYTSTLPKMKKTNLELYGNEHYFGSDEGKEAAKNGLISKYGQHFRPSDNTSAAELEVLEFFNSIRPGFSKQHKYGYEFDGFNGNENTAFEYCGLYWHRESSKGKDLHYNKYKACYDNGIRLFTIFEDEWIYRKDQVKAFIRAYFGEFDEKVFARDLEFVKLPGRSEKALDFFNENHIQGAPNINATKFCYALVNSSGDVVMAISISPNHRARDELVISRVCSKNGTMVVGGGAKLLDKIRADGFSGIKTWSDNRWSDGEFYERNGFTEGEPIHKKFRVLNTKKVFDRISESQVSGILESYVGTATTSYEKLLEMSYDRIWDCGKRTWILN